jgi:ABC-2 type transport system permease protein
MIAIWSKYYASGGKVRGFTYQELLGYYIVTVIVTLISSRVQVNVTDDIKDGELSNFVIKPFNYFAYRLSWEIAWHTVKLLVFAVPLILILLIAKVDIKLAPDILTILLGLVAVIGSYFLSFTMSILIGTLAFHLTETTGISNLSDMIRILFTGSAFPLTFFPLVVRQIIDFTPLKYTIYFPVQVLIGKYALPDILIGLGIQLLWTIILFFLYNLNWQAGIKKFSGVGL